MVGKIVKSSAPFRCANYCLNHDDARVIAWTGLDIDPADAERLSQLSGREKEALARGMAHAIDTSFAVQAQTNPAVEKPVGHIPLCFMKEDAPLLDNALMAQIGREYMEMMGYQNTQYMMVRHYNAKGNPHLHIFFNRVDNDGRCLNAWQDYKRNALACRELTKKHGLHLSDGRKNTIVEDLRGRERVRYQISNAIDAALPRCRDLPALGRELYASGITMEMHRHGTSGEVYGLSFAKADDRDPLAIYTFRGSEVGRRYTCSRIIDDLGKDRGETLEGREYSTGEQSRGQSDSLAESIAEAMIASATAHTPTPSWSEYDYEQQRKKKKRGMHM
jgi:Relaxase/Mobilisation nuclease domain.